MNGRPNQGERFNPFKILNNDLVPTSFRTVKEISSFDKLVYGAIRFEAGSSGNCELKLEALAGKLDVAPETIRRSLVALISAGLLERKRKQRSSEIVFLWSEKLLGGSLQKPSGKTQTEASPDPTVLSGQDATCDPTILSGQAHQTKVSGQKSRPDKSEVVIRQSVGCDPTVPSGAYKEYSGVLLGKNLGTPHPDHSSAGEAIMRPSGRFLQWWGMWSRRMGSNHRPQALLAWTATVPVDLEQACFECTESYILSRGDRNGGYNPENVLRDQARDHFEARFSQWKRPFDRAQQLRAETNLGMKRIASLLEKNGRMN